MSIVALVGLVALTIVTFSKGSDKDEAAVESTETVLGQGAIVYFNLDRVINEYDMANDLSSVVESKINSISEEVKRRGTKLEKDQKAFNDKINKGLMTQSTAEVQYQKILEQQNAYQNYAIQKEQEIAEEQQVMMNQILDAINTYLVELNAEKKYAMILASQGGILPAPVVTGDATLDITDTVIEGINAAYVKQKAE